MFQEYHLIISDPPPKEVHKKKPCLVASSPFGAVLKVSLHVKSFQVRSVPLLEVVEPALPVQALAPLWSTVTHPITVPLVNRKVQVQSHVDVHNGGSQERRHGAAVRVWVGTPAETTVRVPCGAFIAVEELAA